MAFRIQLPHHPSLDLDKRNPLLLKGEVVYIEDGRYKVGPGQWNDLSLLGGGLDQAQVNALLAGKADKDLANVTLVKNLASTIVNFYKAPDGLMLAWGMQAGVASGNHTIYFPMAFTAVPLAVFCFPAGTGLEVVNGLAYCYLTAKSANNFSVSVRYNSGTSIGQSNTPFFWLALGRYR